MDSGPSQEQTPNQTNGHWLTRQHVLGLVLLVCTAIVFYLCYRIVSPFLAPLAWALALAVVAHPVHSWIARHVGNANLAAGLSVVLVSIILLGPAVFVAHQILQEASTQVDRFASPDAVKKWRNSLEQTSVGNAIILADEQFDLMQQVQQLGTEVTRNVAELLRQSVATIFGILITMFTLFFLFRDRREILNAIRSLVPLSQTETSEVFQRVEDTIYATIYGSVMMAMVQGTLGGFMFWCLGLPAPFLWGLVMALLATVPNLGTFIIWAPTAAALALQGDIGKATILAAWGLTAIGMIDNVLYPIVVGKRLHMHALLVFFAVLGGLLVFGPAGMILGPVVFALAQALSDIWRRRTRHGQAAEAGVGAPALVLPSETKPMSPPKIAC